jgi:hypothetical protein
LRRVRVAKGDTMKLKYALLAGLLMSGANAMACYTVYDANSRVLYRGAVAPIDMSMQLHDGLAKRGYPRGAQVVFDQNAPCQAVPVAQVSRPATSDVPVNTIRIERGSRPNSSSPSPLFTDRQTAERAGLPHTNVASNIVVVPPQVADKVMHATVTVLPSETFTGGGAPDTTALGAGPARMSGKSTGKPATARPNVVITEMRDPPMTVIEGGGGVTTRKY